MPAGARRGFRDDSDDDDASLSGSLTEGEDWPSGSSEFDDDADDDGDTSASASDSDLAASTVSGATEALEEGGDWAGGDADGDADSMEDARPSDAEIRAWLKQEARIGESEFHRDLARHLLVVKRLIDSDGNDPPEAPAGDRGPASASARPSLERDDAVDDVEANGDGDGDGGDAGGADDQQQQQQPPPAAAAAAAEESAYDRIVRRSHPAWRRIARLLARERRRGIEYSLAAAAADAAGLTALPIATKAMIKAFRMFTYSTIATWMGGFAEMSRSESPADRAIHFVGFVLADCCGAQIADLMDETPDFTPLSDPSLPIERRVAVEALLAHMLSTEDSVLSTTIEADIHVALFQRLHHRVFGCQAAERAAQRHSWKAQGGNRRTAAAAAATPVAGPARAAAFPLTAPSPATGNVLDARANGGGGSSNDNSPEGRHQQQQHRHRAALGRSATAVAPAVDPDTEMLYPLLDLRGHPLAHRPVLPRDFGRPTRREQQQLHAPARRDQADLAAAARDARRRRARVTAVHARVRPGLEVVRGPAWQHGAQDSGSTADQQPQHHHQREQQQHKDAPPRGVIVALLRDGEDGSALEQAHREQPLAEPATATTGSDVRRRVSFDLDAAAPGDDRGPRTAAAVSSASSLRVLVRWHGRPDTRLFAYDFGTEVVTPAMHAAALELDPDTDVDWASLETATLLAACAQFCSAREAVSAALQHGVHAAACNLLVHPDPFLVHRALSLLEALARHSRCVTALLDRDLIGRVMRAARAHARLTMTEASPRKEQQGQHGQSDASRHRIAQIRAELGLGASPLFGTDYGMGGGGGGGRTRGGRNGGGDRGDGFDDWWRQLNGGAPAGNRQNRGGGDQPIAIGPGNDAGGTGANAIATPTGTAGTPTSRRSGGGGVRSPTSGNGATGASHAKDGVWGPGDSRPNASVQLVATQVLGALASTAAGSAGLCDHPHGYRHTDALVGWLKAALHDGNSSIRGAAAEFFGSALHIPAVYRAFVDADSADDDGANNSNLRTPAYLDALLGMISVRETPATVLMDDVALSDVYSGCMALVTWLKVGLFNAALPIVCAYPALRALTLDRTPHAAWPRNRRVVADIITALARPIAAIEAELKAALAATAGSSSRNAGAAAAVAGEFGLSTSAPPPMPLVAEGGRPLVLPDFLVPQVQRVVDQIRTLRRADRRAGQMLGVALLTPDVFPNATLFLRSPYALPACVRTINKCRAELRRERLAGLLAILRLLSVAPFARVPILAAAVPLSPSEPELGQTSTVVAELLDTVTNMTEARVHVRALDVLALLVMPTVAGRPATSGSASNPSALMRAVMTPGVAPARPPARPPATQDRPDDGEATPPVATAPRAGSLGPITQDQLAAHTREVEAQMRAGDTAGLVLSRDGTAFTSEVAEVACSLLRASDAVQLLVSLLVKPTREDQRDRVNPSTAAGTIRVLQRVLGVLHSISLFESVRSVLRLIDIGGVLRRLLTFLAPHFANSNQRRAITSSVDHLVHVCSDAAEAAVAAGAHITDDEGGLSPAAMPADAMPPPATASGPAGRRRPPPLPLSPSAAPARRFDGASTTRAASEASSIVPPAHVSAAAASAFARQSWTASGRGDREGDSVRQASSVAARAAASPDRQQQPRHDPVAAADPAATRAIVERTQLRYDESSLLTLIADHLDGSGLKDASAALRREAGINAPAAATAKAPTTMTLDKVLTGYLRQQHAACADPVAFAPAVDLTKPHSCPSRLVPATSAGSFRGPATLGAGRVGTDHSWSSALARRESVKSWRAARAPHMLEAHRHHRHVYDARPGGDWSSPTCVAFADAGQTLLMGTSYGDVASFRMGSEVFDETSIESTFLYDRCFPEGICVSPDSHIIGFTLSDGVVAVCRRDEVPTHFIQREGRDVAYTLDSTKIAITPDTDTHTAITVGPLDRAWDANTPVIELDDALRRRSTVNRDSERNGGSGDTRWRASFDPTGNLVIGDAKIWDLRVSYDLPQIRLDKFYPDAASSFHPGGSQVLVDEHVWDIRHAARVAAVCPALHAASVYFCGGLHGGLIYAWRRYDTVAEFHVVDGLTFDPVSKFALKQTITNVSVDPDGRRVAAIADSTTGEGIVKIYRAGGESSGDATGVVPDDDDDDRQDLFSVGSSVSRRGDDDDGSDDDDGHDEGDDDDEEEEDLSDFDDDVDGDDDESSGTDDDDDDGSMTDDGSLLDVDEHDDVHSDYDEL